jgi:L-threonylcarbamoyladenylate synthase
MPETVLISPSDEGLAQAAKLLQGGDLVAFPTETVYGLGGDARSDIAVARIFDAKGRPRFNPLIVHVPDLETARSFAVFDARAEALAQAFWPGPLTLVLPLREGSDLCPLVTAGLDTVAIRVPAHPLAVALLRAFGGPMAAPSANPSGKVSPTRADHVMAGLSGRIAGVLDGGPCAVGVESTIIGLDGPARLLRPGGLPVEAIEAALVARLRMREASEQVTAPGQLVSHYAPGAHLRLDVTHPEPGEVWVGFGPDCPGAAMSLSKSADLVEAAANLFHHLRQADDLANAGEGRIAFAPVPKHGLGLAINDRLQRAAAPRP